MLLFLCGDVELCPGPEDMNVLKQSGMKILHLNVRGLLNNFEGICDILDRGPIDILTLSETHISPDDRKRELHQYINPDRQTNPRTTVRYRYYQSCRKSVKELSIRKL